MGKVIIQEHTTKNPIQLIGEQAGICYGANTTNPDKNFKRGMECLSNQHGRTLEFPDVYLIIDGYSARVIREWYTHIGGMPTRLQASTRYIEYGNFDYIIPHTIENNEKAKTLYENIMSIISASIKTLEENGIPKEDTANLLPLGMQTKITCKINARTLIDMSHQRMCARAYWEYRELFKDLRKALSEYSDEWAFIVKNYFEPKCDFLGYCPEKFSCGKKSAIK
jgi:thymidylate synthase (FAD)